MSILKYS